MKTETPALHYDTPSPLKVIDIASKASRHLDVIKGEEADKKQQNPVFGNDIINDPSAWDASWFSNYE